MKGKVIFMSSTNSSTELVNGFGRVIGIGSYLPEEIMTNDDLSKIVETNDEWITERTGIKERHISDPEKDTSESMAVEAAKKAVADSGIDPKEIGLIVVASTTPNVLFPVLSASVQAAVDADNAMCFDMNAACPGFLTAFVTAQNYIRSGMVKTALVIGTDRMNPCSTTRSCARPESAASACTANPICRKAKRRHRSSLSPTSS